MRLITDAEKAFAKQLVSNTKKLMANTKLEVGQKIAAIQHAIQDNGERIDQLKKALDRPLSENDRLRIQRLISLRREATSYLRDAAKWLVGISRGELSVRQMPRHFASPGWDSVSSATPNTPLN